MSTDDTAWNGVPTAPFGTDLLFLAGSFHLSAGNNLFRSTNGETWQAVLSNTRDPLGWMTTDGRGLMIAMGSRTSTMLPYSPDRVTFTKTSVLPETSPYAVTTDNGASWSPTPAISGTSYLVTGGGRLVAGGSFGVTGGNSIVRRMTTDGVNFTPGTSPFTISNGGRMGYAGGRFFFLGSFSASTDGVMWTALGTPPAAGSRQMRGIAYGNSRYVAVGYDNVNGHDVDVIATLTTSGAPTIATMAGTAPPAKARPRPSPSRRRSPPMPAATRSNCVTALALRSAMSRVAQPTPAIVSATGGLSVMAGQRAELSVTAGGAGPFTYQWFRNGTAVPGASAATLTLANPLVTDAGAYTVRIANAAGFVTSAAATLDVAPVSRISNLSSLTLLASSTDTFTLGYVVGGSSTGAMAKDVVVRAVGPSLASLGVSGVLDDPKLETFVGAAKTDENDNWGGSTALATAFASVGTFPFSSATSRDAAVVTTLNSRDNSVKIAGAGGGRVLAEILRLYRRRELQPRVGATAECIRPEVDRRGVDRRLHARRFLGEDGADSRGRPHPARFPPRRGHRRSAARALQFHRSRDRHQRQLGRHASADRGVYFRGSLRAPCELARCRGAGHAAPRRLHGASDCVGNAAGPVLVEVYEMP